MVHIAIVEDDRIYVEQMKALLKQYGNEKGEVFEITCYSDGDEIVRNYKMQYDIILMDIQMKFMNGMEAAEVIRKADSEVIIIFITNMRQYAIRGYAVEALDYVVKPISYFEFSTCLNKAIVKMQHRKRQSIVLNIRGGMLKVEVLDIYYIESRGHTLVYHAGSGNYEATGTMKDVEKVFEPYNFRRGNKGYLINLEHVEGIQDGCAIVHSEKLLLSRARKNQFMIELTNFWSER